MSVSRSKPPLIISSVLVAEIENKSLLLPISILCEQQEGKQNVETKALLDSGAAGTFIDQQFVKQHKLPTHPLEKPIKVLNVDGTINKKGTVSRYALLPIQI